MGRRAAERDGNTNGVVFWPVAVLVVLRGLWALYVGTADRHNVRVLALALLGGGAVGNAIDRLRSPLGVVDFVDVGVGALRWPTFNLADVAITAGAVMLFVILRRAQPAASHHATQPAAAEAT